MENQHDKLIQQIDSNRPSLSSKDKDGLWSAIARETVEKAAIPSPYSWTLLFKNPIMTPVALALVLMLGTTGLVAASEPTRPGDTLFAVKQATESIRLALASDDAKVQLEAEFAAERMLELSSILEESLTEYRSNNASSSLKASDEKRLNESLGITLSYLGKSRLSTSTKDSLYTELASLLDGAPIRIDDEKLKSYKNDAKVEIKEDNDDKRIEIEDGDSRIRIREKDGGLRIEYKDRWEEDEDDNNDDKKNDSDTEDRGKDRTNHDEDRYDDDRLDFNNQIYFEIKDIIEVETEVEVETEDNDDLNRPNNKDSAGTSDVEKEQEDHEDDEIEESDEDRDNVRVEVRVEDGQAEVRVDSESDYEFTLPYTTKALLITAIALKTGLSEVVISSGLDLEIRDWDHIKTAIDH